MAPRETGDREAIDKAIDFCNGFTRSKTWKRAVGKFGRDVFNEHRLTITEMQARYSQL